MASAPDLTFRDSVTPYGVVSALSYVQSKAGGTNLPVLQGETSNQILFRIYNNFALNSGIAIAYNLAITCYDGSGAASHTAATLPVSQSWIHVLENGYGENSTTPGVFTSFVGADTPIGGAPAGVNKYYPEKGSDGVTGQSRIRAGSNTNGVGFIEIDTYASVPIAAPNNTYTFAISVSYEWTS